MFETIRNAWRVPELRKKMLFTILLLVIFRVGSVIPVPFINPEAIQAFLNSGGSGTIFGYLNVMSGSAFSEATIFALSIYPYINASIIVELLTVAIPALERLSKEGEAGRKKLLQISRYMTIVLALIQAYGYYVTMKRYDALTNTNFYPAVIILVTFAAGSCFLMWLGEQIDDKGIGNGISLILLISIVSRIPSTINTIIVNMSNGTMAWYIFIIALIITAAMVVFVVFINDAERRIPVQYAKRVIGRKMYGGQSSHIPLKINMTGVLPVIFASSITSLPSTISAFFDAPAAGSFWDKLLNATKYTSPVYAVVYFLLIIFFNYFYVEIQYNPVEMANNIQKNGGFIPGIRPGRPTADFIRRVMSKLTFLGALFLGFIATVPIIVSAIFEINLALGGTAMLIVVGVALETVKSLESQLVVRNYKGFLE